MVKKLNFLSSVIFTFYLILAGGSFPDGDSSYSSSSNNNYSSSNKPSASSQKRNIVKFLSEVSTYSSDCASKASETYKRLYESDFTGDIDSQNREYIQNQLRGILSAKENMNDSLTRAKNESEKLFSALLQEIEGVSNAILKAELQEQIRTNQLEVEKSLNQVLREVSKIGSSMQFVKDLLTSIQLLDNPMKSVNDLRPQFEALLATSNTSNSTLSEISLEAKSKIERVKTLE
jgi:hypothetical protein